MKNTINLYLIVLLVFDLQKHFQASLKILLLFEMLNLVLLYQGQELLDIMQAILESILLIKDNIAG